MSKKLPKPKIAEKSLDNQVVSVGKILDVPLEWRGCFKDDYFFIRVTDEEHFLYGRNERELFALTIALYYKFSGPMTLEGITNALDLKLPPDYINFD